MLVIGGTDGVGNTSEVESTAGSIDNSAVAVNIVAPLRALAADALADPAKDTSFNSFLESMQRRRSNSEELRVAHEINFDECSSPIISTTPVVRGQCLAYGSTPAGDPDRKSVV